MKQISRAFGGVEWEHWSGQNLSIPEEVKLVANAFVDLQFQRHSADYDNYKLWDFESAANAYVLAYEAFARWAAIRELPIASTYLLAMLLGKGR